MKLTKLYIVALVMASPSAFANVGAMGKEEVRDGQMQCSMNFAVKSAASISAPASVPSDSEGNASGGRTAR